MYRARLSSSDGVALLPLAANSAWTCPRDLKTDCSESDDKALIMQKSIRARSCRLATVRCSYRQVNPVTQFPGVRDSPQPCWKWKAGQRDASGPPFVYEVPHAGTLVGGQGGSPSRSLASCISLRGPMASGIGHGKAPVHLTGLDVLSLQSLV